MTNTNEPVPTQVSNPGAATKRTLFALITALPVLMVVLFTISGILLELDVQFGANLPENISANIVAVAGIFIGIATTITRVMAIPVVNKWLTSVGLGAVPKQVQEAYDGWTDPRIVKNVEVKPSAEQPKPLAIEVPEVSTTGKHAEQETNAVG